MRHPFLLFVFVLTPLTEMVLLVKLGRIVGFWPTVGLVVLTGLIGAALARREGVAAWRRFKTAIAVGRLPTEAMLDGIVILISAALLLTPGILTDALGFAGLLPASRSIVRQMISSRLQVGTSIFGWDNPEAEGGAGVDQGAVPDWKGEASRTPRHQTAIQD